MRILFSIIFILFLSLPATLFAATDPWVVMARVARGEEGGAAVVDTTSVFSLAKSILALAATGHDTKELVQKFLHTFMQSGQIGNPAHVHDDFWGVIALRSAGVSVDDLVIVSVRDFILRAQGANGGWSWSAVSDMPDTDDTAAAIMALLELGIPVTDPVLVHAFSYLSAAQNSDGGFPNTSPGISSVDSTSWVAMAFQKAGLDSSRALSFLQARKRDDGSWGSLATTSFVTIALAGKWFPVVPATIRIDVAETTVRGPAPLHPAPTASVRDLLGLERGPRNVSPLAGTSPILLTPSLSSPGEKAAESVKPTFSFPAFFPSLAATSIFSKPETMTVVRAAVDSDGDGYPDDVEIANGYDPFDPRPIKKYSGDGVHVLKRKARIVVPHKMKKQ